MDMMVAGITAMDMDIIGDVNPGRDYTQQYK